MWFDPSANKKAPPAIPATFATFEQETRESEGKVARVAKIADPQTAKTELLSIGARELEGDGQPGNDIEPINDPRAERAVITIVKHLDDGPYQFDMDLPAIHLEEAVKSLARCALCTHAVNRLPYESFLVNCDRPEISHDGAAGNPKDLLRICYGYEAIQSTNSTEG
jgi:hypothetical protein